MAQFDRMKMLTLFARALLIVGVATIHNATAQAWPNKPIRFVVPLPPGGDVDFVARTLGLKVAEVLKQPIVIDNRAGAATQIGSDHVAKSVPDGHTFGIIITNHLSNPTLFARLPYDSVKDFAFVSLLTANPVVMAVPSSMGINNLAELIAWSKANPGKLNYASGSTADIAHLTTARLVLITQMNATHIPYKGAIPALNDLLGGQINMIVTPPSVVAQHVQSGRLKAIALSSAQRTEAMPNVPTIAESIGDKSFDMISFYGLVGPAALPREIVERMSAELKKAVQAPDIVETFRTRGNILVGSTPQELRTFVEQGITRLGAIIRQANIKPEG